MIDEELEEKAEVNIENFEEINNNELTVNVLRLKNIKRKFELKSATVDELGSFKLNESINAPLNTEILTLEDGLIIRINAPGFKNKDEIQLELVQEKIGFRFVMSGFLPDLDDRKVTSKFQTEIQYGMIKYKTNLITKVELLKINLDQAEKYYVNGVLTLKFAFKKIPSKF